MNKDIYEVERDQYVGFIQQINPKYAEREIKIQEDVKTVLITSKDSSRLFAEQVITPDEVHYYIYEIPTKEEMVPPKAIRKITLEDKEEVQNFFNFLSKAIQEQKNGRDI